MSVPGIKKVVGSEWWGGEAVGRWGGGAERKGGMREV